MSAPVDESRREAGTSPLRVVAFESRMAEQARKLIERYGCQALIAPALREVGLGENPQVVAFGQQLLAHALDVVVFLTGVGVRALRALLEQRYSAEDVITALSATVTVARGPKTARALKEFGVAVNLPIPEPNTWREILSTIDGHLELDGRAVAVQEYGAANPELLAGLRMRGARVFSVPVYKWAIPEDRGPLRSAIDSIIVGEQDIALFTSATQAAHLCQVAESEAKLPLLLGAFHRMLIGSIGPICSRALRERGITVGFEPSVAKLSHFIKEAAAQGSQLLALRGQKQGL